MASRWSCTTLRATPRPEHAERIGDAAERFDLRLQAVDAGLAAAQVQVEYVLDPQQVFLDRGGHGVEQCAVAAGEAAARVLEFGLASGRVRREVERVAQALQAPACAPSVWATWYSSWRVGSSAASARGKPKPSSSNKRRVSRSTLANAWRSAGVGASAPSRSAPADRRGDPQHAAVGFFGRPARAGHRARRRARRHWPGAPSSGHGDSASRSCDSSGAASVRAPRARRRLFGSVRWRRIRQRALEVGREQHAFAQAGFAARGAQLVEQRQQDDRNVLVAALQTLEVIGQQHDAAHQRRAGFVARSAHDRDSQRLRQLLHLLGDHRRGVQLDHAQRALHLVQVLRAQAHLAAVAGIFGEGLDLDARLAQRLVELRLDPAERGVVDRVAQWRSSHGLRVARRRARRGRPQDGDVHPDGHGVLSRAVRSGRELEVGDRTTQVGRELRQVANRFGGLVGALRGLRGDLLDRVHRLR